MKRIMMGKVTQNRKKETNNRNERGIGKKTASEELSVTNIVNERMRRDCST